MNQDARQFSLLTSKPATQISSSSLTPEAFSLRSALFILNVADNRDVTWQCQISTTGTWDGGKVSGMTTVPTAGTTGPSAWQPCTTPQVHVRLILQALLGNSTDMQLSEAFITRSAHAGVRHCIIQAAQVLHGIFHMDSRRTVWLLAAVVFAPVSYTGMMMQEYLSLPAGTLTFQAQATDLAGNVEDATSNAYNSKTWGPAATPLTTPYAIITGRHLHQM